MSAYPTAESLRRDRDRREKERQKIADAFEEAAKILANEPDIPVMVVIHLRSEAKRWREAATESR